MVAEQYIPVLMLLGVALGFGALFTLLGILLGPKRDTAVKKMPFESGLPSTGSGFKRYSVRFYMVALAFLIFDVEIIFFYPWAVKFREFGLYGFVVMSIFFVILVLGLVYDWRKGALEWD
ncbi:MAG: NADH-quinone oxidoreductase subunit A [SAR324 cluster bacterium]|nr:NADH-quinone oxidoreductase subunit A [SAR324 cluster bacterium]MCZ6531744.1 NADH-quinone oxidoreductase subunit A [SAR324 cluster bacterium]MCZ6556588.1 NADH-quinone oxidoreductase subunit A [SAR324 cluster bacterium]MCZ6628602.1 NADH-quinone oxidoreductase subunit A [SAR324 cluster bacterium]MCZ6645859.1 NADH-quinone oxidoreductase subunit A [SAR324 cluster bacterium]